MGLPIKHRKKFVSHKKRWDKQTIVDEAVLVNDYSLKNKKEIRKVEFLVSKYKGIAKSLNRNSETKNSAEAKHFIEKLKALGYLNSEATSLDEVLDIGLRDILERRLSNILYKNKLARSPRQARQFIVHEHVTVDGKVISSPSYSVTLAQEATVGFVSNSTLADENHPERNLEMQQSQATEEEVEEVKEEASSEESKEVSE